MMRTTLLAAAWGIILLFGADHASAEDPSSPFLKLCEADGNAAGASTADGLTEPETEKRVKPSLPAPLRTSPYPNDCKT
jgi:hypothetical protein